MADSNVVPIDRARGTAKSEQPARPELSLQILTGLALYIRDHFGEEKLADIARAAGLDETSFDGRNRWASLEQVETVLAGARELFETDGDFSRSFAYRMEASLGPVKYVAMAATPGLVYDRMFSALPTFSTISQVEILARSSTQIRLRYRSAKKESRLLCLSRQGMSSSLPTLWGLPPATYKEAKCIGWGDDCCEYEIEWRPHRRRLVTAGGVLLGGLAAVSALLLGGEASLCLTLPALGGLSGFAYELWRVQRSEQAFATETQKALAEAVEHEADARREVLELTQRQRDWTRLMEQYVSDRTEAVSAVIRRLQELREKREVSIRGFSHDLNNPLAIIDTHLQVLRLDGVSKDRDIGPALDDIEECVAKMKVLIGDLIVAASSEVTIVRHSPQEVGVPALVDILRRRLNALTYKRDIKISAFSTREAPPTIEIDPIVLDRIIDNLVTNAAKYTTRGSIIAEVDGTPGFMTLKLSDTGRGIAESQLQRIFVAGGSDERTRARQSHGIGLSVVVQLLSEIGGRLEVMSKEAMGTTFWIHIPEKAQTPARATAEHLADVVHIRKIQDKP
jgi:signal transduction histidine kinase